MFKLLLVLAILTPASLQAAEAPYARPALGRRLPRLEPSQMQPLSLAPPFLVVLHPRHGGPSHGTIHSDGIQHVAEKDVTLSLARRVAAELRARGMTVYLTRETDTEVDLASRTQLANRLKADAFI